MEVRMKGGGEPGCLDCLDGTAEVKIPMIQYCGITITTMLCRRGVSCD